MNKRKIENKYRAITLVNQIVEKLRSYHLHLHLLSFIPLLFTNPLLEAWSLGPWIRIYSIPCKQMGPLLSSMRDLIILYMQIILTAQIWLFWLLWEKGFSWVRVTIYRSLKKELALSRANLWLSCKMKVSISRGAHALQRGWLKWKANGLYSIYMSGPPDDMDQLFSGQGMYTVDCCLLLLAAE